MLSEARLAAKMQVGKQSSCPFAKKRYSDKTVLWQQPTPLQSIFIRNLAWRRPRHKVAFAPAPVSSIKDCMSFSLSTQMLLGLSPYAGS